MNGELQTYLNALGSPSLTSRADWQWRGTPTPLEIACYATSDLPPLSVVSSVRSVVSRDDRVLVMRNDDDRLHIMPGGRCQPGETPEQTVCRELLEEARWHVRPLCVIGCMHLHHTAPEPDGYPYPHPDFLWPIYLSRAETRAPEPPDEDEYEREVDLMPWRDALALPLEAESRYFLEVVRTELSRG